MIEPTVDFESMIQNADSAVTTLSPDVVNKKRNEQGVLVVDIRDVRELEREGKIPDAKHIPRGMLEFWMHPQSPYFKQYFHEASEVILHCNRGWRSALAAKSLKDIGIDVAHMEGGFSAWLEEGLEVEKYERR